ncbi:IclR family transcriptional regulator [Nocardia vermiculata]|uniref:IclR family transcriptional regulator n=1 Tax=Nocardia vermiculata TaxID=257274 RepID=A0A846Y677_9NOCA|nr:IclR family transcriptional regulator [Nocardia vermiculata]NKY52189.1 IclR family transcriptional regulator [Nocardia vermiculata]
MVSEAISQIDRIDIILEALETAGQLTLTEISQATGIPRPSVHRILDRLSRIGWVVRLEGSGYELGRRIFELGTASVYNNQLCRIAAPHLAALQSRTKMVVHLGYLDGLDIVYLDKIGTEFGRFLPSRVGGRQPACRTAVGKALLAHHAVDQLDPGTRPAFGDDLRRELDRVRAAGVAYERGQYLAGVGCAAVSLGTHSARHDLALSLCGPASEFHRNELRLVAVLRQTSSEIADDMFAAHFTEDFHSSKTVVDPACRRT